MYLKNSIYIFKKKHINFTKTLTKIKVETENIKSKFKILIYHNKIF